MINLLYNHLSTLSIKDLERGFFFKKETSSFACIFCGAEYDKGIIYPSGDSHITAERAIHEHINNGHGDAFTGLLTYGKEFSGLSEIQQEILTHIHAGKKDKEIARTMGGRSASTIRNHRFHMRRKVKEAKIYLALMNLLGEVNNKTQDFIEFHNDIPNQDERIVITKEEAEQIREKYYIDANRFSIEKFPKKEKAKLVILKDIAGLFTKDRIYTEKEVNEILLPVFYDYVTIRRYLIEYRFLDRKRGGSEYWRR
jgi:hypothetical protein